MKALEKILLAVALGVVLWLVYKRLDANSGGRLTAGFKNLGSHTQDLINQTLGPSSSGQIQSGDHSIFNGNGLITPQTLDVVTDRGGGSGPSGIQAGIVTEGVLLAAPVSNTVPTLNFMDFVSPVDAVIMGLVP